MRPPVDLLLAERRAAHGETMDPNSHAEKAYEAIRTMIMNRTLRQGASLAVPELAEQFAMSVTPVREAIRRLETEGLLEVIPRRGTFVRSFSVEDLIAGFEVAEAYEGMAGYLVAERVEQGDDLTQEMDTLHELVEAMGQHLDQSEAALWANFDTKFHGTLCLLSRNVHLLQSYQKIRAQMDCVLWFVTPLHVDRNNSTNDHRCILSAVRRGDKEEARTASQRHRNTVRGVLRKLAPAGMGGT